MQVVVEEGRPGYWWKSVVLGALIGPDMDESSPAVQVVSRVGECHCLLRTGTTRQARRAADRYRQELVERGEEQFCATYGLPQRFAEPT